LSKALIWAIRRDSS